MFFLIIVICSILNVQMFLLFYRHLSDKHLFPLSEWYILYNTRICEKIKTNVLLLHFRCQLLKFVFLENYLCCLSARKCTIDLQLKNFIYVIFVIKIFRWVLVRCRVNLHMNKKEQIRNKEFYLF